jgi:hypothetical protein
MSAIDHALEEIIPKDLLLEPPEVESSIVRLEVPDDVPLASNPIGQEITRTVSHASSTLERGLVHEDILTLDVAGQGHPAPFGTTEGASASKGAAKDNPAPEGGAEGDPDPRVALRMTQPPREPSLVPHHFPPWMFTSDRHWFNLRNPW